MLRPRRQIDLLKRKHWIWSLRYFDDKSMVKQPVRLKEVRDRPSRHGCIKGPKGKGSRSCPHVGIDSGLEVT